MTDSSGSRPVVKNSLFNVRFEAEDIGLIPVSLDDEAETEEIKNDIGLDLPPTSVPLGIENINVFKSEETQLASFENIAPIDVFRDSKSKASTPDHFTSDGWLNSHKVVSPPLPQLPGQTTSSFDNFAGNSQLNSYAHQTFKNVAPLDARDPTGSFSPPNQTPTFYNPSSFPLNDNIGNNQVRNSYSAMSTSPPDITLGASATMTQSGPPPPGSSITTAGTGNSFRLSSHKPVYAKYPGLDNMDHRGSTPAPALATGDASQIRPSVFTPASFFSDSENGPGYTFGAPVPAPVSQSYPQLQQAVYKPLVFHWFYKIEIDGRASWKPFSCIDSAALEEEYVSGPTKLVPTDGGRCDVDVLKRSRRTVYWEEDVHYEVRRSSWFYKGPMDSRFIPYDEEFAARLEREYEYAMRTGEWHRRLEMGSGEAIILQNANSIVHYCQAASDEWGTAPESQLRPQVVKRGVEEFEIEYGEPSQVEFLVFLVHGIGSICDFKLRSITEAVDDFRNLSVQMMRTHFRDSVDAGRAGRVEFLPVGWHKSLHSDDGGIDKKLKPLTLPSIPKLRDFTNDTMVDVLLYSSPVYCQKIVDTVASEMNRMYKIFLERNENFKGKVALAGHSLGSVILFDLLAHQKPVPDDTVQENLSDGIQTINLNKEDLSQITPIGLKDGTVDVTLPARTPSYTVVSGGTGQPTVNYPKFNFKPTAFFAFGSPIGMFLTVRGLDKLGPSFHFPTCPGFFNIFHPYDPVAYRMESLVDDSINLPPHVIPHHKGRKRLHLELKDTVTRVSADLKHKVLESLRSTWNTVSQLTSFGRTENPAFGMEIPGKSAEDWAQSQNVDNRGDFDHEGQTDNRGHINIGRLNGGSRIDHVLQESPVEVLNEYLFALTSHVCYWESEDVSLMLLKELYSTLGIFDDGEVRSPSPAFAGSEYSSQPTAEIFSTPVSSDVRIMSPVDAPPLLPVESMSPPSGLGVNRRLYKPYIPFPDGGVHGSSSAGLNSFYGMDPTAPPSNSSDTVGPPPRAGFVSKPSQL